jgi:hypothetical protein
MTRSTDPNVYYLPDYVEAIHTWLEEGSLNDEYVYCYVRFKTWGPTELVFDIALLSESGEHRVTLEGFHGARLYQVHSVLENRFEIIQRPWEIKPIEFSAGSLLERGKAALQHSLAAPYKKEIRVLEVQFHAGIKLISKELQNMLNEIGGIKSHFYVAAWDKLAVDQFSAPKDYTLVEAVLDSSELAGVDKFSLDLIIGPGDEGCSAEMVKGLSEYLLPGGVLITPTEKPSDFVTALKGAGYPTTHSSTVDGANIVQAQAPLIPSQLPKDNSTKQTWTQVAYTMGDEMGLQAALKEIDDVEEGPIWVTATEGMSADALEGLGRSIQKEFEQWNLRLAMFPESFTEADRTYFIANYLPHTGPEVEFRVAQDGSVTVPRVVPSPAPTQKKTIKNNDTVALDTNEVAIDVQYTRSDKGIYVVVGDVVDANVASEPWIVGKKVVSVMTAAPSKLQRIQRSALAFLSGGVDCQAVADSTESLLFASLALGSTAISQPSTYKTRAIVTHSEDHAGKTISSLTKALGINTATLPSNYIPRELIAMQVEAGDIIFTGAQETDQMLNSYAKRGQIASWKSSELVQFLLKRQPALVHDALSSIYKLPFIDSIVSKSSLAPEAPLNNDMFSADKSYLLVGGLGSLGLYVAEWLYRNGARNLILTSRSGRGTIKKLQGTLSEAVFEYLERQKDLNLVVAAVDGSDSDAIGSLIRNQTRPLGGAVLLAATWEDKLFLNQSQRAFNNSYAPKVGSFLALEKNVDINSLDFVCAFSSGTIFGNPGQTNYTAANTALDGLVRKYKNCFSIISPLIHDTAISMDSATGGNVFGWAVPPSDICSYIGDALFKMSDSPVSQYVPPPVDWNVAKESFGSSQLYNYMADDDDGKSPGDDLGDLDMHDAIQSLIIHFLNIPAEDFSPEVPLTSYGLDSITASRLAFSLRPWGTVSQMQLLADMSLLDLEARFAKAA